MPIIGQVIIQNAVVGFGILQIIDIVLPIMELWLVTITEYYYCPKSKFKWISIILRSQI